MPPIRSSASNYYTRVVLTILSLGKVISTYSYCAKKKLVYVIIASPSSRQPSSYTKYIKANIRSSYNVCSISNTKYICKSIYIRSRRACDKFASTLCLFGHVATQRRDTLQYTSPTSLKSSTSLAYLLQGLRFSLLPKSSIVSYCLLQINYVILGKIE